MRSLRVSAPKGFTLIEIALTAGLAATLLSFGAIIGATERQAATLRSERDTLAVLIRTARARAMIGVNGSPHGVHLMRAGCFLAESCYVLHSGPVFDSAAADSLVMAASPAIIIDWPDGGFVFTSTAALVGGAAHAAATLSMPDGEQVLTISINDEGGISYE